MLRLGSRVTQYLAHNTLSIVRGNHYLDHSDAFPEETVLHRSQVLAISMRTIPPNQPTRY